MVMGDLNKKTSFDKQMIASTKSWVIVMFWLLKVKTYYIYTPTYHTIVIIA